MVDLPDLDLSIADGFAACVQNATAEVGHFAYGWCNVFIEDEKIVVGIEGELVRIERAFRLGGGKHELLGESAGDSEERGEELATRSYAP